MEREEREGEREKEKSKRLSVALEEVVAMACVNCKWQRPSDKRPRQTPFIISNVCICVCMCVCVCVCVYVELCEIEFKLNCQFDDDLTYSEGSC